MMSTSTTNARREAVRLAQEKPAPKVGDRIQWSMAYRGRKRDWNGVVASSPTDSGWFTVRCSRSNVIYAVHPVRHNVVIL